MTVALVGTLYGSLACLAQTDVKRVIAYSSIAHMNAGLLGLFSGTLPGVVGAILLMVSHGLVSSALFLLVGVLYDRYHTRTLAYYRGLAPVMPLLATASLFLTLANVALPGTASFPAELLAFLGSGIANPALTLLATALIVLGPCYALTLHHRLYHGALSAHLPHLFQDLTLKEAHLLLPLGVGTVLLGVWPAPLLDRVLLPALHLLPPLILGVGASSSRTPTRTTVRARVRRRKGRR
jgi:NADH-quinone oxidoreductase subunit M